MPSSSKQHRLPRHPKRAAARVPGSRIDTAKSRPSFKPQARPKAPPRPKKILPAEAELKLKMSQKSAAGVQEKRAIRLRKSGKRKIDPVNKNDNSKSVTALIKDYGTLKVNFLRDQHGREAVGVKRGHNNAYALLGKLPHDGQGFFGDLARQHVRILKPGMRRDLIQQIDENDRWKGQLYLAERPGFHLGAYVMANEHVIGAIDAPNVCVDLGDHQVSLAKGGTARGQADYIARFVNRQDLLIATLGVALVGPVLELLGLPNVGTDFSGPSSAGKSTALDVAACVWGAPLKMPGSIAVSMRTTVNGLEQRMRARNGAAVLIDETNLLGEFGTRRMGVTQADLAFMLSEGSEKLRFGDPNADRATFGFLLTSNQSLRSQLPGADRASLDALGVRLITLPADGGAGLGMLSRLVRGFASAGEAIDALKAEMAIHHGHIATTFLKAMVKARRTDEAALIQQGRRRIEAFVDQTHADRNVGLDLRTARALGAIYLALRWAVEWKVLPLTGVGAAMLRCYTRATAFAGREEEAHSAIGRVRAYIAAHEKSLRPHGKAKGVSMSDEALTVHPGLKAKRRGQRLLLISTERWDAIFGNDAQRMLEELKRQSRLQITGTAGFQLQLRVRANKPKDRMYAIVIK